MTAGQTTAADERELIITRVFNAPRGLVWAAWTDPKHLEQWWGPKGFKTRVTEMDLRPGGAWRYVMIGPDGTEYPIKGVFREVVPPERIVTSDDWDEPNDGSKPAAMVVTATFEEQDGKTKLTLTIVHQTVEDRRKHEEMGVVVGWDSTFDCLDEYLAKMR